MERDELIFNYLDGLCTPEQKAQVEHLRQTDASFEDLFVEIQQMNEMMLSTPLEQAPKNFASSVMSAITTNDNVHVVQQSTLLKILMGMITALCLLIGLQIAKPDLPQQVSQILNLVPQEYVMYTIGILSFLASIEFYFLRKEYTQHNQ